jgi:hypothetical protein
MTNEQIVAQSLAARSISARNQSESNLLILAAISKDPTVDGAQLKAIWIERWLKKVAKRAEEG